MNVEIFPDFDFSHFGKYLEHGLWPFLVAFVVSMAVTIVLLPLIWVLMIPTMLIGGLSSGNEPNAGSCVGAIAIILVMLVFAVIIFALMPAGAAEEPEAGYGLAWLLQLIAELREWDDPESKEMLANLRPLEDAAALDRLKTWLPKLSHPVRIGEHAQTAFALGLMLDYARSTGNESLAKLLNDQARKFYFADMNCPMAYEPSGEDFLSPCLAEADVMRRVLPPAEFASWLKEFIPQIPTATKPDWLPVTVSPDPSDPKLAHLDGLNLSRARMLEGTISALPADDARRPALDGAADAHRRAGLAAVTGAHYEGGHWLGSFAVYLVSERGVQREKPR